MFYQCVMSFIMIWKLSSFETERECFKANTGHGNFSMSSLYALIQEEQVVSNWGENGH